MKIHTCRRRELCGLVVGGRHMGRMVFVYERVTKSPSAEMSLLEMSLKYIYVKDGTHTHTPTQPAAETFQ